MTNKIETTKSVSFSIDGKWLADLSRTRVKEGDYQHALKILDALEGLPLGDQIDILKGKKDLIGINDIELIDGDKKLTEEMNKFYERKYGSMLKWKNQYYEPYLLVNSWCIEDLPKEDIRNKKAFGFTNEFEPSLFDKMNNMFGGNKLMGYPHSRTLHYSQYENDLPYTVEAKDYPNTKIENGVILFKQLNEQIPFWVEDHISDHPKKAIEKAIKNKKYIARSGAQVVYEDILKEKVETNPFKSENPYVRGNNNFIELSEEEELKAIEDLRKRIKDYADQDKEYGWKHFENENGLKIKVPGRAFMHYALNRCGKTSSEKGFDPKEINLLEYIPFSKSGLKMTGDDTLHTDAWLGAGFDLNNAYDHEDEHYKLFIRKQSGKPLPLGRGYSYIVIIRYMKSKLFLTCFFLLF